MSNFKTRLQNRDYPARIVEKHLSEIKFSDREMSLAQKNKTAPKKILPFVTQYHPDTIRQYHQAIPSGNMSSSEDISYLWAEIVDFFRIDVILIAKTENDIQSYDQTMIRRECFPRYENIFTKLA